MKNQEKTAMNGRRRRLVLFPLPLQGHINPMIQLATVLHKQNFSISIIHTEFNSIDHTKYPDFNFHKISDGLSGGGTTDTSDVVVLLKKLNINCAGPFRECFRKLTIEGEDEEDEVVCLITDTTWYITQEVADSLRVPRIAFRTTSVCSFLAFDALPSFHRKGYLLNKDLETEVSEFPPLRVKDIPMIKTQEPETLYQLTNQILEIAKRSSGIIFNTFKDLEENELIKTTQQFHSRTFAIGPLHKYNPTSSSSSLLHQDRCAITWLDKQSPKSVLYISFGSLAVMNETELCEVALGLANSKQNFLWVIRPGSVQHSQNEKEFPNGFLKIVEKRGCIVNWAPQEEVLAHHATGGFWTHSGWNSTLESICEGVPMICSPFFGDQMVNSRYVSDVWRIGVRLEKGFQREEIQYAIRKVMADEEGEEIRKRVVILKEKSQQCVQHDGSSYHSLKGLIDYVMSL